MSEVIEDSADESCDDVVEKLNATAEEFFEERGKRE
jgi:hypothetical protein